MITLKQYTNEENQILPLIQGFWKAHSHYDQSGEEAQEDLTNWTKDGHIIYFIQHDETVVGFAHLGSRVEKQTGWKNFLFCQNIRETASAVKQFISWKRL